MNQKLPNIFKYATKELSQDAFLCWLLSLADKAYETEETMSLHLLAIDLISALTGDEIMQFSRVKVRKQVDKIDIWVEIDQKYLVVIEDKTNSNAGFDQLKRYKKIAADYCEKNNFEPPTCIYLKTGLESATKFTSNAKNEGWTMFSLETLFAIIDRHIKNISHPFLIDYYSVAEAKVSRRENYASFITATDSKNDVISVFYKHLEEDGIIKRWKVEDMRGVRRLIADNCYSKDGEYAVYLQLEKLKLKVKIDLGQLRSERDEKYKSFKKKFDQFDSRSIYTKTRNLLQAHPYFKDIAIKPAKFSKHNYLTVADIPDNEWLAFTKEGTLDYAETSAKLKAIDNQLTDFITSSKASVKVLVEEVFTKKLQ